MNKFTNPWANSGRNEEMPNCAVLFAISKPRVLLYEDVMQIWVQLWIFLKTNILSSRRSLRINLRENVSQTCFHVMLGDVTAGCCGKLKLQASRCANENPEIFWSKLRKFFLKFSKTFKFWQKLQHFVKNQHKIQQFLTKILRLESRAKECIV